MSVFRQKSLDRVSSPEQHDQLIAQNGFFAELVARQRLDEPAAG